MIKRFAAAIAMIPALLTQLKPGLQALHSKDRRFITVAESRSLSGSVDIDHALRQEYPTDHRWDYCVGVKKTAKVDFVVWIEVHPANSHSASDMVAKATWLFSWLKGPGRPLLELANGKLDLRWISTSKVAFRRGGRQHRQLANAGIGFPERHTTL